MRETPPGVATWLSSALVVAGILLLSSIVRILGGNIAGAIGLVVLSLHPDLSAFSFSDALALCCLSALMFLLVTTHLRPRVSWAACAALAVLLFVVPLSRNRRVGLHSATNLLIRDPGSYLLSAGRTLCTSLGTAPTHFNPLLAFQSGVTLWWLCVSIQSRNVVPFLVTATPLAYLLCGSLVSVSDPSYARRVHPILLADLIAFLGLWWRGRANKRVLDSTTN